MYQTEVDGKHYELGTSGFLYRSNKLMYDHESESFWSTLQGTPVVGPLVDKGIELKRRHVVTTTWKKWRSRHPDTAVLSLETGHRRDYGEGVAYHDYFATDKLMFDVPSEDDRLLNKDHVFALRHGNDQVAIAIDYLKKKKVHAEKVGDIEVVIFADESGTSRAFESKGLTFEDFNGIDEVTDSKGQTWKLSESELSRGDQKLARVPSHRVFWFGWRSQYPETRLVK